MQEFATELQHHCPIMLNAPQISLTYIFIAQQLLAAAAKTYLSVYHDISPVREFKRMMGILFNQEDSHAVTC